MPFTLGQRWISDTESELGLGTVVAVDARTVTLLFPSTGENRLYARSDSPVTRVMFNPGDTITSHDGWQMQVEEVKEEKKEWLKKNTDVVLGSDAFFPFGDNIERAHKSGVKYVGEPGGSIRDDHVIDTCDKYDMVLAFTHQRLFHH